MHTHIKNRALGGYDLNLIAVVGISTLVLVLQRYYPLDLDFPRATELIYYVLIPLAAGWLLFRDRPRDYGFRIGNWKWAMILTPACLAVMGLILYGSSKVPEFRSYYYRYAIDWSGLLLDTALYMFAWEFLFRGCMLFGLEKSIGESAILVQLIPFCAASSGEAMFGDTGLHPRRLWVWLRGIQDKVVSALFYHTLRHVHNDGLLCELKWGQLYFSPSVRMPLARLETSLDSAARKYTTGVYPVPPGCHSWGEK